MMNKKGLSQVVTTVLIILIVLAAIVIIWAFIRPTIESAGEQITADCITLNLEVVDCTYDDVNNEVNAMIRRNAGEGDLKGIRLVLSNGSVYNGGILNELETTEFTISYSASSTIDSVNVVALVGEGSRACSPQHIEFTCSSV